MALPPHQPREDLGWSLEDPRNGDSGLNVVERRMLERGKKEHHETTLATTRALQVAEQCQEMATATLIEVQRQGHALDKAEHGLDTANAAMDKTRRRRVALRAQEEAAMAEGHREFHLAQQAAVLRMASKGADPAYNGNDAQARSELLAANIRRKISSREGQYLPGLGYGLPDADKHEIEQETQLQDATIDRIGTTVEKLKMMTLDLQGELEIQAPQIDRLGDRTHVVHDGLSNLAKSARRV